MSNDVRRRRPNSPESPASIKRLTKVTKVANPDRPVHEARDSFFSLNSAWTNCNGLFNLAVLLLIVSNGRAVLQNLTKYGILISPLEWINWAPIEAAKWPMVTMIIFSNVSMLLALIAEKFLESGIVGNRFAAGFYITLITAHFTIPAVKVLNYDGNPLFSVLGLTIIVIEGLKLVSYAHVNYWCRCAKNESNGEKPNAWTYPNNLTITNLYYYMFAPTLCYELCFPRTLSRRKSFILKRVTELIAFSFIIVALGQQWLAPAVKDSILPSSERNLTHLVESLLTLAIPNHLLWLLGFYTIFHSALNLIAEILRFADREFYLDFWNSETITDFWRSWNIPVHRWAVRHVYKPIVSRGYSKLFASTIVFFISGFFHEYVISTPLHMFRLWAFGAMLSQIPLIFVTDKFLCGGRSGNIVVWLSLILGQPMAILMYINAWYAYPVDKQIMIN